MFDAILGNDKIKKELKQAIDSNKISHSYLFIGTDGIGKKQIAKELSKAILCLKNNGNDNCKSCLEFDSSNNPDFKLIEPDGTSIKIEQIRQLQRKLLEAPIISKKKVYLIDDADLMTTEAQNCLLKTIEEPPEFVNIILIGSKEERFLNTIKSRCTILKFNSLSDEEIKQYLKEKYEISDFSDNMLQIAQGSIGKAENIKEKRDLYNAIFKIVDNLNKTDLIEILKQADIIYKSQDEKNEILDGINVMLFNKSKEDIRFLNCIQIVEETKRRINFNGNYNMCIDNMLFKIWEEMH